MSDAFDGFDDDPTADDIRDALDKLRSDGMDLESMSIEEVHRVYIGASRDGDTELASAAYMSELKKAQEKRDG